MKMYQLSRMFGQSWLFIAIIAFLTPSLAAQISGNDEITVQVELSRSSVYVGDELSYQVVVRGAKNPQPPEIEFPNQVRAQFHGRTSQSYTGMRIINGVRRSVTDRSFIFQYTLTAMEEGSVRIDAPVVIADGQTIRGQTSGFEALLPTRSNNDEFEISIDRQELYQNETVEIECVWWIGDNTSEFNLTSSILPESFEVRAADYRGGGQYKIDFTLNGQSMSGYVETATRNGREMSRFTFRMSITPTETGSFELGPMRSIFTRQEGTGNRYRAYVESNTIPIVVMSVPAEGRPDNYEGAIGHYTLTARASNTNVNVGDPIELTLRIRGDEPMMGVQDAPDLTADAGFVDRFKIDSDGWREIAPRNQGTRLYEITIRALDDRVTEIPPVRLPSFNPILGTYKVYSSDPIPINVKSVKEVTLADALINQREGRDSPPAARRPEIERIELTPAAPGLWAHDSGEAILRNPGFNLAQTLREPIWQTTLAGPPTVFLLAWGVVAYRRSRDPDAQRLALAYRSAKRARGVNALHVYIAIALNIDPDSVTAQDARLLPVEVPLQEQVYQAMIAGEGNGSEAPELNDPVGLVRAIHDACTAARKAVLA